MTKRLRFVDLFAGLGGFHVALRNLGHECVFVSEFDQELREVYLKNFPDAYGIVHGDIRECKDKVPAHDILCAGFPCQPFSKSGDQRGMRDKTRGTLFHEILEILERHRPQYVILENVGNFERHDNGRTWRIVKGSLTDLDYHVRGTEHVSGGGHGLVSPHHLGLPHSRERFFVVASLDELPNDELRKYIKQYRPPRRTRKAELLALLPSYARVKERRFPKWKIDFIELNREWFDEISSRISTRWVRRLLRFPPSLRKLEWNCQGEERDLWRYVLQFRPSGLRVKRYSSCPALVAMTTTQIPILGPKRRFITRVEGLRLQGFADGHALPGPRERAFRALGNAVHVTVVREIARRFINSA